MAALLAACGGESTAPEPRLVLAPRVAQVGLDASVSPAAAASVAAIHSLHESLAATRGDLTVSAATPVIAANAAGDALFVAYADSGGDVVLGPRGTASTAVGMMLHPPFLDAAHHAAAAAAIPSRAGFEELVSAIAADAAAGRSFLDTPATMAKVRALAASIVATYESVPPGASLTSDATPVFERAPRVSVADGPGNSYTLQNGYPYWFVAAAVDTTTKKPLGSVVMKPYSTNVLNVVSWFFPPENPSYTLPGGNGVVRLTLSQNDATRRLRLQQAIVDVAELALKRLLPTMDGDENFGARLVASILPLLPAAAYGSENPVDAARAIGDALASDAGMNALGKLFQDELLNTVFPNVAFKTVTRTMVKATVGMYWEAAGVTLDLVGKYPFYDAWVTFGNDTLATYACQQGGVLRPMPCVEPETMTYSFDGGPMQRWEVIASRDIGPDRVWIRAVEGRADDDCTPSISLPGRVGIFQSRSDGLGDALFYVCGPVGSGEGSGSWAAHFSDYENVKVVMITVTGVTPRLTGAFEGTVSEAGPTETPRTATVRGTFDVTVR